jgi:hypothetical protein
MLITVGPLYYLLNVSANLKLFLKKPLKRKVTGRGAVTDLQIRQS